MKKILLINPPWVAGYYTKAGFGFPPLGLEYLSASLKNAGHKTYIMDMNVEKFDYIHYDFSIWDMVGITADTTRFGDACNIAKTIKQKGVPVVIGGSHASAVPESILENNSVDYVILGEGEEVIVKLVSAIKDNEKLPEINNLASIVKLSSKNIMD